MNSLVAYAITTLIVGLDMTKPAEYLFGDGREPGQESYRLPGPEYFSRESDYPAVDSDVATMGEA